MDVRILGIVEVVHEGQALALGGPKQRALLARLVIDRGNVVSLDRLAEDLWEGQPPRDAAAALQPHVSRLRRAISPSAGTRAVIVNRRPGYAMCLEAEEVDACRFETGVHEARAALNRGEPGAAQQELLAALGLWRGPALADVAFASFAQSEITRLEELRVRARELLAEARLALGQHLELVGELEVLVSEYPLRERLSAHHMLALYRCGRQADALRAYQDLRHVLGEELGIEPSPEVQALELAILRQDPALMWVPPGSLDAPAERPSVGGQQAGVPEDPPLRPGRSNFDGVGWSYGLLSASERALLQRMTVFVGSASLQAIEEVCGDEEPPNVVGDLSTLVAKSLVVAESSAHETRYRLLEMVCEYASAKLRDAGEKAAARSRHAEFFVSLAERVEPELTGGRNQRLWVERLDVERGNVQAALEWSVADGQPELALRLCAALAIFWQIRGDMTEARQWLNKALEMDSGLATRVRTRALWAAGFLAVALGDRQAAAPLVDDAVAGARLSGDRRLLARCLLLLGQCSALNRNPLNAVSPLEESAGLAREVSDTWCLVQALVALAGVHEQRGGVHAARPLLEQSLALARDAGDNQSLALALNASGRVALAEADYASAEALVEESLGLDRDLGNRYGEAEALALLGEVFLAKGAHERARDLLRSALQLARDIGSPPRPVARSLHALGLLAHAEGDLATAREHFSGALGALHDADLPSFAPLLGLADVAHAAGDFAEAGALLEEALSLARADTNNQATASAFLGLARLARSEGDGDRGEALAREALRLWSGEGDRLGVAVAMEELARVALWQGDALRATWLFSAAQSIRVGGGYVRAGAEQVSFEADLAAARSSLGQDRHEAAWQAGRTLEWDEALSAALGASGPAIGLSAIDAPTAARDQRRIGRHYQALAVASPEPQPRGRWGERLAVAGGGTGHGVPDLFVSAMTDVDGRRAAGRVYALSGRALREGRAEVRYVIDAPEPQVGGGFGYALCALGDVDGDGIVDIAVGGYLQDTVWVFSGATGSLLYGVAKPVGGAEPTGWHGFGSRLGNAGDLDGDGACELIVGCPGHGDGAAYVFRGSTGKLLHVLHMPAEDVAAHAGAGSASPPLFGLAVHSPGDTDGDGVPDLVVAAPGFNEGSGRMYLFCGKTGRMLAKIDSPEPQKGALFGFQDVAAFSPGDVDGDGCAEIYGNGFRQGGDIGRDEGRAWVLHARTGEPLYTLRDPVPRAGGQFGWSLLRHERDDGVVELCVGSSPHHLPGCDQSGGTHVFDARDGAHLASMALPPEYVEPASATNWGPNLGWSIAAPGDVNGDGVPDYIAGAPFTDVGEHQDQGVVFVFLSEQPTGSP